MIFIDKSYQEDCGSRSIGREYISVEFADIIPNCYELYMYDESIRFSKIKSVYDMLNTTFPDWRKDAVSKRVINE